MMPSRRVLYAQSVVLLGLFSGSLAFRVSSSPAFRSLRPTRAACLPRRCATMLSGGKFDDMAGRGDLEGGMDAERNARIAALKKSFYWSSESTEGVPKAERSEEPSGATEAEGGTILGVMKDMPLCRWEMVMLPGFNQLLNVWQPMYTHMFESLIATEQPWYYVHLQTPGGTKNLMNPEYSLTQGSKAPMVGVLMRVVAAQRREDSRLGLVVQGLSRVRILEETQKEPYARATVQLLPDDELVSSCYARAKELMGATDSTSALQGEDADNWLHTVAFAGAVASEQGWQEFENAPIELEGGGVSVLCPFSTKRDLQSELAARVQVEQEQVMKTAIELAANVQQSPDCAWPGAPVLSTMQLVLNGVLGGRQSGAKLAAIEAWEDGVQIPEGLRVQEMESRLWVELDALVLNLRRLGEAVPVPSQMMGLLPPPPAEGWPGGFTLDKAAEDLVGSMVGTSSVSEFVRVGGDYDPLRRAQKLSYVACTLLGIEQNAMLGQAMLEARNSQHRLGMLLKLFTDVNRELQS